MQAAKIKELRLIFCTKSSASAGLRSFVIDEYSKLKIANPSLPILVRYGIGVQSKIIASFDAPTLETQQIPTDNSTAETIKKAVFGLLEGKSGITPKSA